MGGTTARRQTEIVCQYLTQWNHKAHWKEKRLTKAPKCLIVRLLLQSLNSLSPELLLSEKRRNTIHCPSINCSISTFDISNFQLRAAFSCYLHVQQTFRLFFKKQGSIFLTVWMQYLSKCGLVEIYSSINPATEKQDTSVILQKRRLKQRCV